MEQYFFQSLVGATMRTEYRFQCLAPKCYVRKYFIDKKLNAEIFLSKHALKYNHECILEVLDIEEGRWVELHHHKEIKTTVDTYPF